MIKIARIVRCWESGIAEATLLWNTKRSRMDVVYKDVTRKYGPRKQEIPPTSVRHWLIRFVRDPSQLQPDSYAIVDHPTAAWREVIINILQDRGINVEDNKTATQ